MSMAGFYSEKTYGEWGARWHRKRDDGVAQPNLAFYSNTLVSSPRGALVEDMHDTWFGQWPLLEAHHGYIQWIFPTFTYSAFNGDASPLGHEEAAVMRRDVDVGRRIVASYRLMLDFYGMRLLDERKGTVGRSKEWRSRFSAAIVRSGHNHLRICRIMSSLMALGFRRYVPQLLLLLNRELARGGGLYALTARRSRAGQMWNTYGDVTTAAFRKYTGITPADLEDAAYLLELDKAEKESGDAESEVEVDKEAEDGKEEEDGECGEGVEEGEGEEEGVEDVGEIEDEL
eukprot:PLAT3944.3.p1 GENE.PLAT3944.3~~PLAT3944.3.p1  ORF type:complete len:287 (-),score=99.63 PLAT3944.3:134-994(-)